MKFEMILHIEIQKIYIKAKLKITLLRDELLRWLLNGEAEVIESS